VRLGNRILTQTVMDMTWPIVKHYSITSTRKFKDSEITVRMVKSGLNRTQSTARR